jgi:transcriptional regulator with XRE-family HTH domain
LRLGYVSDIRIRYNCGMDQSHDVWVELGALVKKAREDAGLSQPYVADLLAAHLGDKFTQGMVSANESGQRWGGRGELIAAYARVLNISIVAVERALRLPPPRDASEPLTFADMVRADPSIDEESKRHLINQYGLLRAATAHNRTRPSGLHKAGRPTRDEIEARDDIPRDVKDMLLADLEATSQEAGQETGDRFRRVGRN